MLLGFVVGVFMVQWVWFAVLLENIVSVLLSESIRSFRVSRSGSWSDGWSAVV